MEKKQVINLVVEKKVKSALILLVVQLLHNVKTLVKVNLGVKKPQNNNKELINNK